MFWTHMPNYKDVQRTIPAICHGRHRNFRLVIAEPFRPTSRARRLHNHRVLEVRRGLPVRAHFPRLELQQIEEHASACGSAQDVLGGWGKFSARPSNTSRYHVKPFSHVFDRFQLSGFIRPCSVHPSPSASTSSWPGCGVTNKPRPRRESKGFTHRMSSMSV